RGPRGAAVRLHEGGARGGRALLGAEATQARARRGHAGRRRRGPDDREAPLQARPGLRGVEPAGRARAAGRRLLPAAPRGAGFDRLALLLRLGLADAAVGGYARSGRDKTLADEELERRPGALPALEQAVDLHLSQHRLVALARFRPVSELRQATERLRELHRLLQRALELLLAPRDVLAGLAEGVRQRAEGVPVERLRRHPATVLLDVAGRRDAAQLLPQSLQQLEQLFAGCKAPRHETGLALGLVPAAEVLDYRLRMDAGLRVGREFPHRRRTAEPFGASGELDEDLLVCVGFAEAGLEGFERLPVDARERTVLGPARHRLLQTG